MLRGRNLPWCLPSAQDDKKGGAIAGAAFLLRSVEQTDELT
jgi:hypothetical protein